MYFQWYVCTLLALFSAFESTKAATHHGKPRTYQNIQVNPSGLKGDFKTIQAAIDSVPSNNTRWTCINVKQGVYREQVRIPKDKPFIFLKGDGMRKTRIVWDAHESIATSGTFTSEADYTMAKGISFVNSYNSPPDKTQNPIKPAVAAMIRGDKSVFYMCGFFGVQDTIWDVQGRHYFKDCTIQGSVDFIFGAGQSHYEGCSISVVAGALHGSPGFITAQGRSDAGETNGFVFKDCKIDGKGKTFLGRPWRDHARVLFYNTSMSEIVVPQGWDACSCTGHENQLTFSEHNCRGPGSDRSGRVKWAKKLGENELEQLTSTSFIDNEGWMKKLAFKIFPDDATDDDWNS